jgi:hypothetical protein
MFPFIGPEMVEALMRRPNESIEKIRPPAIVLVFAAFSISGISAGPMCLLSNEDRV